MRVIGDKNQIHVSEDVIDFMISYLPFPQKSISSELAKLLFWKYIIHSRNYFIFKIHLMTIDWNF